MHIKKISIPRQIGAFEWKTSKKPLDSKSGEYFKPRAWHRDLLLNHAADPNLIINCPCGAGKSFAIMARVAKQLTDDTSLACIITVPQTPIGAGFKHTPIELPDGEKVTFDVGINLCTKRITKLAKKTEIRNFLKKRRGGSVKSRVIVITQQAAAQLFRDPEMLKLLKKTIFVVDEAHHLQIHVSDDMTIQEINGMGRIITHVLESKSAGNSAILATATLFRGNRFDILTKEQNEKFGIFRLPLDEWMSYMRHLKSFREDFHVVVNAVDGIPDLVGSDDRTIIFVPHTSSRFMQGVDKIAYVNSIVKKIAAGRKITYKDHLIVIGDNEHIILDMVDETLRARKKEFLETVNKDRDCLHTIIAMRTCGEGFDWIHANFGIIIGEKTSLTDRVQTVGRFARDADARKTEFRILNLLPIGFVTKDPEVIRQHLNSVFVGMLGSMMFIEMLSPAPLKREKVKGKMVSVAKERLVDLFEDENEFQEVLIEARNIMVDVLEERKTDIHQSIIDGTAFDAFSEEFEKVLANRGIEDESIPERVWRMFTRQKLQASGIDPDKVAFDIIKTMNPLLGFMEFSSDVCDIKTLKEIREAIHKPSRFNHRNWDDFVEYVRKSDIVTCEQYKKEYYLHDGLPSNPNVVYPEWKNWPWLFERPRDYPKWDDYVTAVRECGIKTLKQHQKVARENGWHSNPHIFYKDNWNGYRWLFTGKRVFPSYKDWCVEVTEQNVRTIKQYNAGTKVFGWPTNPSDTYKTEWLGWGQVDVVETEQQISADNKKKILLDMANRGDEKPAKGTVLGSALRNYTHVKSSSYDEKFTKKAKKLAPKWFIPKDEEPNAKRKQLIEAAKNGGPRPKYNTPLGRDLIKYTHRNPEFKSELEAIAPHWFTRNPDQKKIEILEMARRGENKPHREKDSLGIALRHYMIKSSKSYDPVFDTEIRKLRPDWFQK